MKDADGRGDVARTFQQPHEDSSPQESGHTAQSNLESQLLEGGQIMQDTKSGASQIEAATKDMRLYPLILLMMYRTDPQIVLQFLEGLLQGRLFGGGCLEAVTSCWELLILNCM